MDRKKLIRALKFCIIGIIIATIVLFALGVHTIFTGLMGAISSGTFGLKLNNEDPSGDWTLLLNANPANKGFLGERIYLSIGILDKDGKYIAVNSTSVGVAPGQQSPFSLTLTIPAQTVQKYQLNATQGADVRFELLFGIRTLGDLVGFQQTMRIAGGNVTIES
jgi:hypothetical protein